ncbi:MAG: hypothetical protein LC808_41210, partial [Actinobacteria bacterium]|nr:hypothetical protein [Actinomycetota bacterium]
AQERRACRFGSPAHQTEGSHEYRHLAPSSRVEDSPRNTTSASSVGVSMAELRPRSQLQGHGAPAQWDVPNALVALQISPLDRLCAVPLLCSTGRLRVCAARVEKQQS